MKAVVMAGGFGTRIQPLTNSIPKPMLPILNRPMMEHIIIKARDDLGIKEFVVLLYFKPEVIRDYFKDGSDWGIKINYVLPNDDFGTAGAVGCAREFLDETFIIVSGDLITDIDFKRVALFHKEKNSKLTITLTPVEDPLQFGVVIANEEGRIEKFLEKPSWGEVFSDTINTGIYMIEPEILDFIPEEENFDFAKDLFPLLMKKEIPLWGSVIEGYWRDVGNPLSYREVYKDIFEEKIKLPIKGELKEFKKGKAFIEEGVEIDKDVKIEGLVVIGKNVKIEEDVLLENVVIGDNTEIAEDSEIRDCVIWKNSKIDSKTNLKNCVICNDNHINKKVVAKEGVIIAENCEIKKSASFEKDVIVWPNKSIEEESIISNNIIWGDKYKSSIFEESKVVGRTNIELSCEMATKLAESFGSVLPIGSKVYVSRDYHKSSRMLKRAFLSGLLSTGINVVDLEVMPSNVMRYNLSHNEEIVAGIHIRQSIIEKISTEIILFTSEGLGIDNNLAKNIERIFFRENFRRVNHYEIGDVCEANDLNRNYIEAVKEKLDINSIKHSGIRIVTDIMFGSTSNIYPKLVNSFGIENIVLNAYRDDKKLSNLSSTIKKSQNDISNIVKVLGLNIGFLIYPNGQKIQVVSEKGSLIEYYQMLLVLLRLLDMTTNRRLKIFLPAWAPDFIEFENLDITRGKYRNFKAIELKEYDLVASTEGNFAFTEFAYHRDAIFASMKIIELLAKANKSLSEIVLSLPKFAYIQKKIECPSEKKGKMMRKFLEDGKDKKNSHIDGVKIWIDERDWILMVPDQHSENIHIVIQAKDEKSLKEIFENYNKKIQEWLSE